MTISNDCQYYNSYLADQPYLPYGAGMLDAKVVVGARLKRLRLFYGFSQEAMGETVGIGQSAWNHYEKGERLVSVEVAAALRDRYGISLDWLYCGSPAQMPIELLSIIPEAA